MIDGNDDEVSDGFKLDTEEGANEGNSLGIIDGPLGKVLGESDGRVDGVMDGFKLDFNEGYDDGTALGSIDGREEGSTVDAPLGSSVGSTVGSRVGKALDTTDG